MPESSDACSIILCVPRLRTPVLAPVARPRWLTLGLFRLLGLCAFIVLIGMLPGRLTRTEAGWVGWSGLAVLAVAVPVSLWIGARRITQVQLATLVVLLRRYLGLVGLAAGFFLFWTFVYLTLWWRHPATAFVGLGQVPRFADFFYYAVSTSFVSPPGDIIARSRGVRSATMIEMLTGFALLAVYLSSFVDWSPREQRPSE